MIDSWLFRPHCCGGRADGSSDSCLSEARLWQRITPEPAPTQRVGALIRTPLFNGHAAVTAVGASTLGSQHSMLHLILRLG
eukprot:3049323-Rhodomonas_salina.2